MMMQLPQFHARIVRLRGVAEGLGREVSAWKGRESPQPALERRRYLHAMNERRVGAGRRPHGASGRSPEVGGRQKLTGRQSADEEGCIAASVAPPASTSTHVAIPASTSRNSDGSTGL